MIYYQSTGKLTSETGSFFGQGYSGNGEGKNNPFMQNVHDKGPIPCGLYTICPAHRSDKTGPLTMTLIPDPTNNMYGRSDFAIHGDNILDPGNDSHGCIVMPHTDRENINNCTDKHLEVRQ